MLETNLERMRRLFLSKRKGRKGEVITRNFVHDPSTLSNLQVGNQIRVVCSPPPNSWGLFIAAREPYPPSKPCFDLLRLAPLISYTEMCTRVYEIFHASFFEITVQTLLWSTKFRSIRDLCGNIRKISRSSITRAYDLNLTRFLHPEVSKFPPTFHGVTRMIKHGLYK